jgi:predicted Zn-dependent protease
MMKQLNQEEAKRICDRVLSFSKADECSVAINGSREGNIRFARNSVSTAGLNEDRRLTVTVAFGKRQGTASSTNSTTSRSKRRCAAPRTGAPGAGKSGIRAGRASRNSSRPEYFAATAASIRTTAPRWPRTAILAGRKKPKLVTAGFFTRHHRLRDHRQLERRVRPPEFTGLDFTCTARTEDGRGSGWVTRSASDARRFDAREAAEVAIEKALRSVDAKALEPGRYTVILEPAATSELLGRMFGAFGARQADEGRSFLAKKGGGNRLGEKLFDEQINVWSDPWDKDVPVSPWDTQSMLARQRTRPDQERQGRLARLLALLGAEEGLAPTARPGNMIMAGGSKSLEELIASTKKGVVVTRTWYIRMVDPQSLLLTGLTRDGTFYVENGKIKYPIKNFRFNESPVTMLNNVEELGKPVVIGADEVAYQMVIPPMRIRDFNFTSLSDAV